VEKKTRNLTPLLFLFKGEIMTKKIAIVVLDLIPESQMQSNSTIATEIEAEMRETIFPYVASIQKVTVLNQQ